MEKNYKNLYLYYSAITANILTMSTGCQLVWTSPVIPKLLSNDTSINPLGLPISVLQVSLLTSLNSIGVIVGTVLLGKLPDIIGRKRTLMTLAVGGMVSFIGLYFAKYFYQYIILILLMSTNISTLTLVVPIYTAEIAEDRNRGKLGCLFSLWVALGQLYGYIVGAMSTVNAFFLFCAIPLFVALILSIFIPESPIYLSMKGEKTSTIIVLRKLRKSNSIDIETEYAGKERMLQSEKSNKQNTFKSFFVNGPVRKALILCMATRYLADLCGITIVLSFMATLLDDMENSLSGDIFSIIVVLVKLFVAITAIFIIERAGRRVLILGGAFVCGLSMFVLGLYFYFQSNNYKLTQTVRIIPLIAIICFCSAYTLGLSSVPYILRAELLPNELRSIGSNIAQFVGTVTLIVVSFAYPLVSNYLGLHYSMFAFSFFCFSGFIFLLFSLPETKCKSFTEIRNILNK